MKAHRNLAIVLTISVTLAVLALGIVRYTSYGRAADAGADVAGADVAGAADAGASDTGAADAGAANNGTANAAPTQPPKPVYPVNANGETYGSGPEARPVEDDPDLIACVGLHGIGGYARTKELNEATGMIEPGERKAPEASLPTQTDFTRIPLYASDGITVVDEFVIAPTLVPEHLVYAVSDGVPGYFSLIDAEPIDRAAIAQAKRDYAAGETDKLVSVTLPFYGFDQTTVIGSFTSTRHISEVIALPGAQ